MTFECNVDESPLRYIYSLRDGVGKGRRRQNRCAVEYKFGPPNDGYVKED